MKLRNENCINRSEKNFDWCSVFIVQRHYSINSLSTVVSVLLNVFESWHKKIAVSCPSGIKWWGRKDKAWPLPGSVFLCFLYCYDKVLLWLSVRQKHPSLCWLQNITYCTYVRFLLALFSTVSSNKERKHVIANFFCTSVYRRLVK